MREDLIERLRSEAEISARPGQMDRLNALADEFAAALEAAREDAERYRWLRKGVHDDIAVVRGLGAMDSGMGGEANTYSKEIDGDDLDAAIDRARLVERQGACGHLRDFATGKLRHVYRGDCPDQVNGPDARDPACPACQAIEAARFGSDAAIDQARGKGSSND